MPAVSTLLSRSKELDLVEMIKKSCQSKQAGVRCKLSYGHKGTAV